MCWLIWLLEVVSGVLLPQQSLSRRHTSVLVVEFMESHGPIVHQLRLDSSGQIRVRKKNGRGPLQLRSGACYHSKWLERVSWLPDGQSRPRRTVQSDSNDGFYHDFTTAGITWDHLGSPESWNLHEFTVPRMN